MATYFSQIIVSETTASQIVLNATESPLPVPAVGSSIQVTVDKAVIRGTVKSVYLEITQSGDPSAPLQQIVHTITVG